MPEADPIPIDLECVGCRYNLIGLAWGAPCPECGHAAPATWPTPDLREAHASFIRSTRGQLRGLMIADTLILAALACLAAAYIVAISIFPMTTNHQPALVLFTLGIVALIAGLLVALVMAGMAGRRHTHARADLDQPTRKGLARAFWWCVGPVGVALLILLAAGGVTGCLMLIALPISIASAGVLAFTLFEHDTSIIKRCHAHPAWTPLQIGLGYGSIAAFVLFAFSIATLPEAAALLVLAGCAMLVLAHALRTRAAQRSVRRVQAEIQEPIDPQPTSADQPPASPRS